jgi:hypothetical protein
MQRLGLTRSDLIALLIDWHSDKAQIPLPLPLAQCAMEAATPSLFAESESHESRTETAMMTAG